jgi:hypothetical protein
MSKKGAKKRAQADADYARFLAASPQYTRGGQVDPEVAPKAVGRPGTSTGRSGTAKSYRTMRLKKPVKPKDPVVDPMAVGRAAAALERSRRRIEGPPKDQDR